MAFAAPMSNHYRHRFDFDIGYLVKSPCRECHDRDHFPGCMQSCHALDRIHAVLANSVSSSHSRASMESHAIYLDAREEK